MDKVQVTIIGAGVIGLAVARELAGYFPEILVLEKNDSFGRETSSRNSEVIHSGIYYPADSFKARLCVEGSRQLYNYCCAHDIPHKRLGKLIIASGQEDVAKISDLHQRGIRNGVGGLELIDAERLAVLEPRSLGVAALWSPNTGIINSHVLMSRLYGDAVGRGVLFAFNSEVASIQRQADGYEVGVLQDDFRVLSDIVINAAGLNSDKIAELAGLDVDGLGCRLNYCKGDYFSYSGTSPVSRLLYPVPGEHLSGLGVHATLDLAGQLRFGPDTEDVTTLDYTVDERKKKGFFQAASRLIPGLEESRFMPHMAGIRPKIKGPGVQDFVIRDEKPNGFPNFINLVGIESPGLTSCLAIAKTVRSLVDEGL
ncbi:MAG: NAD(P)/FAD-dependent oxidoreductase [bacterium]